jgi:hypothetical protein
MAVSGVAKQKSGKLELLGKSQVPTNWMLDGCSRKHLAEFVVIFD